jgi:hypothetical protein
MSYIIYQQQQPVVWMSQKVPASGSVGGNTSTAGVVASCSAADKETLRLNHNRWGWLKDSNERDFEVGLSVIRKNRSLKKLDLSGLLWKQHYSQNLPFHGTTPAITSTTRHDAATPSVINHYHPQRQTTDTTASVLTRWFSPDGAAAVPTISPRTIRFLQTLLETHSSIEEVRISQGQGHPLQPNVLCSLLMISTLKRFYLKDGLSTTTQYSEWLQFVRMIGDSISLETLSLHNMDYNSPSSFSLLSASTDKVASSDQSPTKLNRLLQSCLRLPRLRNLSLHCHVNASAVRVDEETLLSLGRLLTQQPATITSSSNHVRLSSLQSLELLNFQLYDYDLDRLGRAIMKQGSQSMSAESSSSSSSLSSTTSRQQHQKYATIENLTIGNVVSEDEGDADSGGCGYFGSGLLNLLSVLLHPTSTLRKLVIRSQKIIHPPNERQGRTGRVTHHQQPSPSARRHRHHHQSPDNIHSCCWEDALPALVRQNYNIEELLLPIPAASSSSAAATTSHRCREVLQLVDIYLKLNRGGRRRLLRSPSTTQTEWVNVLSEIAAASTKQHATSSSSSDDHDCDDHDHSLDVLYLALRENPRFLENAARRTFHPS